MSDHPKRHLFEVYGVELEYVLVDRDQLAVRSQSDQVLKSLAKRNDSESFPSDYSSGRCTWSNELALHVIELKNTEPVSELVQLRLAFQSAIEQLDSGLEQQGLRLLPTSMHPWMNPQSETRLWPHECADIYQRYHHIFNCYRHGWANVQSVHLNLPFDGDQQFASLHAAVRLVLPLLPALAASSPIVDSAISGWQSTRMKMYATHCDPISEMMGLIVPEPIFDESTYRREIFLPIQRAMLPHDPGHIMQCDFLNARGAIARFDRGSIEIRVMDVQEYPDADLAICAAAVAVIRALTNQKWRSLSDQKQMPSERLRSILMNVARNAQTAIIDDCEFLSHFGVSEKSISAVEFWSYLIGSLRNEDSALDQLMDPLTTILQHGTLSTRILSMLGNDNSHQPLVQVYNQVADCLTQWRSLVP